MSSVLQGHFRGLTVQQRGIVYQGTVAIQVLLNLHHYLTPAQAFLFFVVWTEECLPVSVLSHRCGIKPPAGSRLVRELSSRELRSGRRGLGLLIADDRQQPADYRLRHVFLSKRGDALAERMVTVMATFSLRRRIAPMGELMLPLERDEGPVVPDERG